MSTTNSTIPKLTLDYYASLRLRYYINFGINTLATIVACFIVARKSPEPMKTYKWFLLNIAIWSFLMDLNMTLFFMPLFLLPAPALCSLGFVKEILGTSYFTTGISLFFLILTLTGCGTSIVCALYYRYRLLSNKSTEIFTKKYSIICMGFFHLFSGTPIYIAGLLCILFSGPLNTEYYFHYFDSKYHDQWKIWMFCLDNHVCICGGVISGITSTDISIALIGAEIFMYLIIIVFGSLYVYHILKKRSKSMTFKSYDHEKKLIVSLFFQSLIPIVCSALPYCLIVIQLVFQLDFDTLMIIFLQISTLHSLLNAFAMILLLKPYRLALKDLILLQWLKTNVHQQMTKSDQIPPSRRPSINIQMARVGIFSDLYV